MAIKLIPSINPRSRKEKHRSSTPLELFFDLVFVVAIASIANALHHAISDGYVVQGLLNFLIIFWIIWWAWNNFTWFASAYDNDDALYRIIVFIQMTGALIFSSGVNNAFESFDFRIMTLGYVVMRGPLVYQWIRVAIHDLERNKTAKRYAWALSIAQIIWICFLFIPQDIKMPLVLMGIVIEMIIPIWAEKPKQSPWHPDHITERHGLFTIIVLGESILAASLAIQTITSLKENLLELLIIITGGLLVLFSLWWIYFNQPKTNLLSSRVKGIVWGYGHYFIFSSAAAIGVGFAVMIDLVTTHTNISQLTANLFISVPVSIFLMSIWLIHMIGRKHSKMDKILPVSVTLIMLSSLFTYTILIAGILLVLTIIYYETNKLISKN